MSRYEVLALMPGPPPVRIPDGLEAVAAGDYVAFLREMPGLLARAGRKRALREAAARARAFEDLLPLGVVLPVMPHTHVPRSLLPGVAHANGPLLERLADRLRGKAQYQICIAWDAARAPSRFGWPSGEASTDGLRCHLQLQIGTELDTVAVERLDLPLGKSDLANCVVLIDADDAGALDRAVATIDALWTEGLQIRQIGPSPAVSFASLVLERKTERHVSDARKLLSLKDDFSGDDLREARRHSLLASPGGASQVKEAAECLEAMLRLPGKDGDDLYIARLWSEGRAAMTPGEAAA